MTAPDDTSGRFRWLASVRAHQERQARVRALRTQLAEARAAGLRVRHARRQARIARSTDDPA